MDEKKLIPENDLQELWELNGRKCAVMEYIKNEKFHDATVIYRRRCLLGGRQNEIQPDGRKEGACILHQMWTKAERRDKDHKENIYRAGIFR